MKTVADSTGLDDQNRARREGSVLWGRTKALLDELEAYRAVQPMEPDTAKVARAQHAREAKAERKRAAVSIGVERYRLQLLSWTGTPTARAKWLAKLLGPDAPHWRYVYDQLKTMQI